MPPDEDDNRYYHQPNGHSPVENIIGEGNHRNSVVQLPLLDAFQHQEAMVPPATPGSGQENVDDEALHTTTASTYNYVLINPSENTTTMTDLGGLTSNITILALTAAAASVEQQMLPRQILPHFSSTTDRDPPIQEIRFCNPRGASLLTLSSQNNSSGTESSRVSSPVSVTNAPYGAYLSVPESIGLKDIGYLDEAAHDLGYDSDGEIDPFYDAVAEEAPFEDYEEEDAAVFTVVVTALPPGPTAPPPGTGINAENPPELSESVIRGMKVVELRDALRKKNQTVSGTKDVLVQHLLSCSRLPPLNVMTTGIVTNDTQPTENFHRGGWRLLEPDLTPLEEPNKVPSLVAPTTHSAGATEESKKHNYSEQFDRDPFTASSKEWIRNSNGSLKVDQNTGEPLLQEVIHEKGRLKWSFLKQNKLTMDSHPAEWFFALLPEKKKNFHHQSVVTM
jgi:hypothetical protein